MKMFPTSFFELNVHYRRDPSAETGWKSTSIKIDFFDKKWVDHTNRPASCSPLTKMIGIGNFNIINEEKIFAFVSTSNQDMIVLVTSRGYGRKSLHHSLHIHSTTSIIHHFRKIYIHIGN